ncbi:hypothetical protein GAB14E_1171 [Colwellia psychrerythraea]|uniref:Uncharacterized protein n=1 Tax=Colwellia psychrerythraea TaxID=28229 RepID=A0A099L633_COLPS|nr:hypothetical protein GAB14E_1171 [Colwellia psychrerythraea]
MKPMTDYWRGVLIEHLQSLEDEQWRTIKLLDDGT